VEGTSTLKLVNPILRGRSIIACIGKGTIISIDRLTGQVEWEYATGEQLTGELVLQGENLAAQTGAGKIQGYRLERVGAIPVAYALRQNFPNPFGGMTTIRYELPVTSRVKLSIHDAAGRAIVLAESAGKSAGYHQAVWDGRTENGTQSAAGTYFARLKAGSFTKTITMIKVR
jgi:hypothetical protein